MAIYSEDDNNGFDWQASLKEDYTMSECIMDDTSMLW